MTRDSDLRGAHADGGNALIGRVRRGCGHALAGLLGVLDVWVLWNISLNVYAHVVHSNDQAWVWAGTEAAMWAAYSSLACMMLAVVGIVVLPGGGRRSGRGHSRSPRSRIAWWICMANLTAGALLWMAMLTEGIWGSVVGAR